MVSKRIGWKGVIYDAPWAKFKNGQDGVIVSDDGKTCETTYDDVRNVIIVADENRIATNKTNGHAYFEQKETGKSDIVAFSQSAATRTILVDNVELNTCASSYSAFKNALKVYEIVNGGEKTLLPKSEYVIESPKPSDNFINTGTTEMTSTIKVLSNGVSGSSTLTITPAEEGEKVYTSTTFQIADTQKREVIDNCEIIISNDNVNGSCLGGTVKFSSLDSATCDIIINEDNVQGSCEGGNVKFIYEKSGGSLVKYKINFEYSDIMNYYEQVNCLSSKTDYDIGFITKIIVKETDKIRVEETTDEPTYVTIIVEPDVEKIECTFFSNVGFSETWTIPLRK